MATLADLDEVALSLPQTTRELSPDGRPSYLVHSKLCCRHRNRRKDAVDALEEATQLEPVEPYMWNNLGMAYEHLDRLEEVLMFRVPDLDVKELLLADARGIYFTTPHFDGYAAVLVRIPQLARLDRDELHDLVAEAWLTRAQKRVAKAWLEQRGEAWAGSS